MDNKNKAVSLTKDSVELMIKNFETQKLFQEHYNTEVIVDIENVLESLYKLKNKLLEINNG